MHSLLAPPSPDSGLSDRPSYGRPSSDPWAERDYRDYPSWRNEPHDPYRSLVDEDAEDPPTEESSPAREIAGRRWGLALAVGCQATAWWLRREAGRFTTLQAMGVGLASTLAAYVAGPVLWASARLVGSALALAALSDAARSGAAALFGFGMR